MFAFRCVTEEDHAYPRKHHASDEHHQERVLDGRECHACLDEGALHLFVEGEEDRHPQQTVEQRRPGNYACRPNEFANTNVKESEDNAHHLQNLDACSMSFLVYERMKLTLYA